MHHSAVRVRPTWFALMPQGDHHLEMTSYVPVPWSGPEIEAFLVTMRWVNINGGAEVARLRAADVHDPADWFPAPPTLDEDSAFTEMVRSPALRESLPALWRPFPSQPQPRDPAPFPDTRPGTLADLGVGFRRIDVTRLDVWLAESLTDGGAYHRFPGPEHQANALGAAVAGELLAGRDRDFEAFTSRDPWAPWFEGVAWDWTLVLVDRAEVQVTLMCLTDTD
jgi:hypothetical protein